MKTLFNKSSNDLLNTTVKFSVFLAIAFFAVAASAQSINDDLRPKKTIVKPPAGQPRQPKTVKPKTGAVIRKQPIRNVQPAKNIQPVDNPPVNNLPPPVDIQQPVAQPTPVAPLATPEQILERFINFQQSAGVTVKDWESVVAQTRSDTTDEKSKAQLFIAQGHIAYSRGDYSSALVQFNAAAQVLPDSALPHYSIGKVYMITKQPSQAENSFAKAIKLNKKFALAYQGMGEALTAQKKTNKARDYYEDAARIGVADAGSPVNSEGGSGNQSDNQTADPTTSTISSAYEQELKSARAMTAQKKWQSSLDKLLPLAKSNPTDGAYLAIGDNYFGMEQWFSALQAYRKATELNSNSAMAFYKTGLVLFETNEFQSAAEAFEKALIIDQNGMSINRQTVRKMADRAGEKAEDIKGKGKIKKKNFLGM